MPRPSPAQIAGRQRMISLLEADGFRLEPTPHRTAGRQTHTEHLLWRGAQVAYLNPRLSGEGALLGYRFDPGTQRARNACPAHFSLEAFAQQHGLDASTNLRIRSDPGAGKSYLRVLTVDAALLLMRASAQAADLHRSSRTGDLRRDGDVEGEPDDADDTLARDLDELARRNIDATTKKRLVDARIGQGRFRKDVEGKFGAACRVTGIRLREALRASHILAWARATDAQRLDPDNGLLLAAHLDALFDKHLITFGEDGAMKIATRIIASERKIFGLGTGISKPSPTQRHYLQMHNAVFNKEEEEYRVRTEQANRRG